MSPFSVTQLQVLSMTTLVYVIGGTTKASLSEEQTLQLERVTLQENFEQIKPTEQTMIMMKNKIHLPENYSNYLNFSNQNSIMNNDSSAFEKLKNCSKLPNPFIKTASHENYFNWQDFNAAKSYKYEFLNDCETTCRNLYLFERTFKRIKSVIESTSNGVEISEENFDMPHFLKKSLTSLNICYQTEMKKAKNNLFKKECDCYFSNIIAKYRHSIIMTFIVAAAFIGSEKLKAKRKARNSKRETLSSLVVDDLVGVCTIKKKNERCTDF